MLIAAMMIISVRRSVAVAQTSHWLVFRVAD
jgi:hypothetical protein